MPDENHHGTVPALETWVRPGVEVISLACEVSGYTPDDQPLF